MAQRLDTSIFNGYACMAPFCRKLFWKWEEAKRHMHHECKALPRSTNRPKQVESIRKALDIGRKHREDHPELQDDRFVFLNADGAVLPRPQEVGRKKKDDKLKLNNDGTVDGDVRRDGKSQGAPTIKPVTTDVTAPTAPMTEKPSEQPNISIFKGYACLACSCQAVFWEWEEAKHHMLLACASFPRSIKRPQEVASMRKALDLARRKHHPEQRGHPPERNDEAIFLSADGALPQEGAFQEARTIELLTVTAPRTAPLLPKPSTVANGSQSQGVRPQSKKRPRTSKISVVPPLPKSATADISNLQIVLWDEAASQPEVNTKDPDVLGVVVEQECSLLYVDMPRVEQVLGCDDWRSCGGGAGGKVAGRVAQEWAVPMAVAALEVEIIVIITIVIITITTIIIIMIFILIILILIFILIFILIIITHHPSSIINIANSNKSHDNRDRNDHSLLHERLCSALLRWVDVHSWHQAASNSRSTSPEARAPRTLRGASQAAVTACRAAAVKKKGVKAHGNDLTICRAEPEAPSDIDRGYRRCQLGDDTCDSVLDMFLVEVTFDHDGKVPYIEGQSIGVIAPGPDKKGETPARIRLYSIASSAVGDDETSKTVSLCVKRVVEDTPDKAGTAFPDNKVYRGVCSNHICDLSVGDDVMITGPTGAEMLLPEDPEANIVMLATGTGIAPMRAYCRYLFNDKVAAEGDGRKFKGLAWLFMGVPYSKSLLYDDEHQEYISKYPDQFRYDYAISREQTNAAGQKMYIQTKMAEYAEELWELMQDEKTHIYMCGLKGMESGMAECFTPIAEKYGKDWAEFAKAMKKADRYHVEELINQLVASIRDLPFFEDFALPQLRGLARGLRFQSAKNGEALPRPLHLPASRSCQRWPAAPEVLLLKGASEMFVWGLGRRSLPKMWVAALSLQVGKHILVEVVVAGKYRRVTAGGDELIAAQRRGGKLIDLLAVEQGAKKTQKTGTLVSPSPGEKTEKKVLLFDGVFRQEIFGSALAVSSQAKAGAGGILPGREVTSSMQDSEKPVSLDMPMLAEEVDAATQLESVGGSGVADLLCVPLSSPEPAGATQMDTPSPVPEASVSVALINPEPSAHPALETPPRNKRSLTDAEDQLFTPPATARFRRTEGSASASPEIPTPPSSEIREVFQARGDRTDILGFDPILEQPCVMVTASTQVIHLWAHVYEPDHCISTETYKSQELKKQLFHRARHTLAQSQKKPDNEDGKIYLKRYGDLQKGFVLGQRDIVDPGGPAMHEPTVRCEGRCKILRLTRRDYLHCLKEMQVEKHRIVHALRNIPPSRPGEPHQRSEEQLSLLAKLVRNTPELKNFERPTLMQVLGAATYVNAAKGHVLCKQGEIGDQFYAIIESRTDTSPRYDGEEKGTMSRNLHRHSPSHPACVVDMWGVEASTSAAICNNLEVVMRASPTSRRFQKVKLSLQPCWLLFVLSAFSRTSKLSRMARPFHAFLAALLRQSAQEAVPGDLLGDDECLESSTCALNALQMRGKAMEAVEERQMPWMMMPPPSRWGMPAYHPSPVMPPWRRPEPMGPMPYYSPESYMHPQPASYMHPQPVEPADMPQPEEEHPKMVTRHVKYLPLSPIGWGMIADDEGVQVRQLTSDLKGCEGECTKDEKIGRPKVAMLEASKSIAELRWLLLHLLDPCRGHLAAIGEVQHVEVKQCGKDEVPEPSGSCVASTKPELMTFYQYSAQKKQNVDDRVWENVNFAKWPHSARANIGGVMFYLHNEVVDKAGEMRNAEGDRTPKFNIDRILRFKVTMKNPEALWKKYRQFIQFDYGQATFGMPNHVEKCNEIWETVGYEVDACKIEDAVEGQDKAPQGGYAKTAECMERQGRAGYAGEDPFMSTGRFILLDDLVGQNLKELYKKGGTQYDKKLDCKNCVTTDAGQGTSFWNGKKDTAKCKERWHVHAAHGFGHVMLTSKPHDHMVTSRFAISRQQKRNLFAEKYRDQPAALTVRPPKIGLEAQFWAGEWQERFCEGDAAGGLSRLESALTADRAARPQVPAQQEPAKAGNVEPQPQTSASQLSDTSKNLSPSSSPIPGVVAPVSSGGSGLAPVPVAPKGAHRGRRHGVRLTFHEDSDEAKRSSLQLQVPLKRSSRTPSVAEELSTSDREESSLPTPPLSPPALASPEPEVAEEEEASSENSLGASPSISPMPSEKAESPRKASGPRWAVLAGREDTDEGPQQSEVPGSEVTQDLGKMVNRLGAGAAFGAKTLLKKEARTASVMTVEPTKLLVVTREDYVALLGSMEEARQMSFPKLPPAPIFGALPWEPRSVGPRGPVIKPSAAMVVRAANGRKKPKARKAAGLLKRKAAEPSGEGEQPLAAEVSAFVESLGGLGGVADATWKRPKIPTEEEDLPPELQDAEILGGSSDADASISSEDEGKVPMNRKERKEAEKQARKQAEAEKKVQQAKAPAKTPAKPAAQSQSAGGKRDGQIFLAALPPSVDGDTLRKDFAKFGEISRFYFHKDSDGSPRGTACIFYKDPDDADKVILLDGIDYKGNAIKVKRRPPRKPGGKQVKKQQERAVNEAAPTKEPAATQTSVPFACKAPGSGILKRTQKHVAKHTAAKEAEVTADEAMPEGAPKAKKAKRKRVGPFAPRPPPANGSHFEGNVGASDLSVPYEAEWGKNEMKSCTLDRGSVLLRHGEPECKEVTILRQGAVAFCYPPGHEGKEARSARTPRYAAAAMGASQIVTTPGELIGVYSAIFKDPEPATVRVESATCDIYRVPWAGYASNVQQAEPPIINSQESKSINWLGAVVMALVTEAFSLGAPPTLPVTRPAPPHGRTRGAPERGVSSTLTPAATALAAGVLANRRSGGARGAPARGVRIQAVSSRTNGLVEPHVEGPTDLEQELGSLGAKAADVQAMELSKLEAEEAEDEEAEEEGSALEPAKRIVNTREVELWPGIPDPMVDFGGLPIPQRLADAFTERGILQPSSIQELVMPKLAKGEHIILHAPTGSGKTLAYLLPILARLQPTMHVGAQAIIFVPTPELALQVTRELKWLIYVLAGGSDGTCWFNPQVPQGFSCDPASDAFDPRFRCLETCLGYGSSSQNFLRTQYFRLGDPCIMAPMSHPMDQQITAEGPTIAIFNVAMIGHVNPTFALVQELCKRGCKVSYFLPPVAPIRAAAMESGAVVEGYLPEDPSDFVMEKCGIDEPLCHVVPEILEDDRALYERAVWPLAQALLCGEYVIERCRQLGVSVVLYDPSCPLGSWQPRS
ncbi:unnamed protein product [Symbiodinium microadriaticum]|nr:unnamed protein product [Symbiodinium microadriaticum]